MKYLFFDIECACVYKSVAKICAFGYTLTDEKFNVLLKEDVLLNPKGRFRLTDRKGEEGLVLPYQYEEFSKYPVFPKLYARFKELLENKEHIVLGHATHNDVNYLNLETKRYKLPAFRFQFYDTQFFYMNLVGDFKRQYGLQAMAEELGVEFTPHRAADDAYATMRVCEVMCRRMNTDLAGLIRKLNVKAGRAADYRFTPLTSSLQKEYMENRERERAQQAKAHETFYRFVNKHMARRKKGGALEGKVFCFDRDIEEDFSVSGKLVEAIFASGGKYTSHPTECNVYIAREEGSSRMTSALSAGAAFVPLNTLENALNLS